MIDLHVTDNAMPDLPEGTIYKFQRPIGGDMSVWLIYPESRAGQTLIPPTEEMISVCGSSLKFYATCEWSGGVPHNITRVASQPW